MKTIIALLLIASVSVPSWARIDDDHLSEAGSSDQERCLSGNCGKNVASSNAVDRSQWDSLSVVKAVTGRTGTEVPELGTSEATN